MHTDRGCSLALRTLSASVCRVLDRLECLEALSLAGNQLASLPPGLFALNRLRILDLSDNCLAHLQPDIGALQELQVRQHPLHATSLQA